MQRWAVLLAATLSGGCDDKQPVRPSDPAVPVRDGLSVNDEPQAARAILALGTAGETAWRVTVATDALSCEDLRNAYPERPPTGNGMRLDFWVRQPLAADGSAGRWGVRSAYITDEQGGRGLTTRGGLIEDVNESSEQVKLTGVELACSDGDRVIAYTGAVLAKNCGRVSRPEEDRHQSELALTVAGQRVEVHGASVLPRDKRHHLRLTRAPHRCDSVFTEGYDFFVDVALEGDPPKVAFASLAGDRFPEDPSGSKGKEAFVVTTDPPLADSTDEVNMTLKGALDLSGYRIELDGKLSARRCY